MVDKNGYIFNYRYEHGIKYWQYHIINNDKSLGLAIYTSKKS